MTMLEKIKEAIREENYLYTQHARAEMVLEDFGEIRDEEVCQAILGGKIIENYPEDLPYPSCLIYGRTFQERPLHIVCAYAEVEKKVIIVTVYEPDPEHWINLERRKK